jgi:hypothetical protein
MSEPRFIFDTVDYQNGANTFNNYVNNVNATNNAAATGNSFQFRTDADRMKYLTGTKGKPRLSGYYDGLYAALYALTVVQNGSTIPSINGPSGFGWGNQLWAGPITDAVNITDSYLHKRAGISDYVGIKIAGYIYSPVATTIVFKTVSDDGVAVYFNGQLVINAWIYQGPTTTTSASVTINPGYNPITILFFEGAVSCTFQFTFKIANNPEVQTLSCGCFYNYAQL